MLGKTYTFSRTGMNCYPIEVEVDLKKGLPGIFVTGMLSQEVKEARERVRPAITNSGIDFPIKRITINLAPAEMIKTGTHYDLAIAIAVLKAARLIADIDQQAVYFGELNLSGQIKRIRGILPLVVEAIRMGFTKIFIPEKNLLELSFIDPIYLIPVNSINDLIKKNENHYSHSKLTIKYQNSTFDCGDYQDVKGQKSLVNAFKIAAAGNHHMLIIGPPGSGKTMAASRLPGIMPDLAEDDILELNMIYSIASLTILKNWLMTRPFRTPHNSATSRALIGGGPKLLPGEVSLAHKGILFLDEFLEFRSDTLQALRTVIEKKEAIISLRNGFSCYPADFLLIAAANPCPCGYFQTRGGICSCLISDIKKYRRKLKNPLTDRIDLQVKVDRINYHELTNGQKNVSSKQLKNAVLTARKKQIERYQNEPFHVNSEIPANLIARYCRLNHRTHKMLEKYIEEKQITARSCHKILRISRTIADLAGVDQIKEEHIFKAMSLRILDLENCC